MVGRKKQGSGSKSIKSSRTDVESIVAELMSREDRQEPEFRLALLSSQVGDIARYITHDPVLNPNARPHGSKEDEKMAYGQVIVQLMGLVHARGLSYADALSRGLKNWQDADWRKREAKDPSEVSGRVACPGAASGIAYVVSREHPLESLEFLQEKRIIVTREARPEYTNYLKSIMGLVTDQGGVTSHAANISREYNLPCIVGTGNATQLIKHGSSLVIDALGETGRVYVRKS